MKRISENQKVTLTIGQLRRLVRESIADDYGVEDFCIRDDGLLLKYFGKDKDVVIPDEVNAISYHAFFDNGMLTSVTIPDSVTSIGERAFQGCDHLKSITIPDSVTSIGDWAFWGCRGLASVTIGNGVTSIGESAFSFCRALKSLTIGNSVTSIGDEAFYDCENLTSVTIPNGVRSIGKLAFAGCETLSSVTIPDSVTDIGRAPFDNCSHAIIYVSNQNQKRMILNDTKLSPWARIIVKGENSDDDEILVREATANNNAIDVAFKKGVHSCAEDIEAGIKDLLQYYTLPPYPHQCDEFRAAFEQVKDVLPFVRALIEHTGA